MSFSTTKALFFYGHTITKDIFALDFSEGGPEIQASLRVKSYSFTEFAREIQDALNAVGGQEYTVTVDRTTRKITISAPGNFELLASTGTRTGSGVWALAGFTATDKTGTNTYESENASGSVYQTQAVLREYTSAQDFAVKEYAKVNVAASGIVQTVTFGDGNRIEFNVWLITDKAGPFVSSNIDVQANAVQNTRDLLNYLISKARFEFMEDKDTPGNFSKCILEKSPESGNGTGYRLYEMDAKDFFETKNLLLRVVT